MCSKHTSYYLFAHESVNLKKNIIFIKYSHNRKCIKNQPILQHDLTRSKCRQIANKSASASPGASNRIVFTNTSISDYATLGCLVAQLVMAPGTGAGLERTAIALDAKSSSRVKRRVAWCVKCEIKCDPYPYASP